MSRSAVAYQLKKLKDMPVPETSITIILAQGFEPKTTTVAFTPHDFEQYRQSDQIYATRQDMYEMRGEIIHKTTLPQGIPPSIYPEIADLVGANPSWYNLPDRKQLHQQFNNSIKHFTTRPRQSHQIQFGAREYAPIYGDLQQLFNAIVQDVRASILPDMPDINQPAKLLRYMATMKPNVNEIVRQKTDEVSQWNGGPIREKVHYQQGGGRVRQAHHTSPIAKHSPLVIEWALRKGIPEDSISFCITNKIFNKSDYEEFKKSGVQNRQQMEELETTQYSNWREYQLAQKWATVLHPFPENLNNRNNRHNIYQREQGWRLQQKNKGNTEFHHIDPKKLKSIQEMGWGNRVGKFNQIRALGFTLEEEELHDELKVKIETLGLQFDAPTVAWARTANLEQYDGFPSPRAATIYGVIEMSPTTHLRLDSLLTQYQRIAVPGPDFVNVSDLHALLSKPPFTEICVSNLEGGIVEKLTDNVIVVEKEVVKEVVVEKEVEKKVEPLFDYSAYSELNSGNSKMNQKVRAAIDRSSLDDSLTASFTRFEFQAKKLWKKSQPDVPLPDGKGAAVKLIDQTAAEMKFTKPMLDKLQQARMLRNEDQHPQGLKMRLTLTHVKRLLDATEKIIVALG